jgi:N-acetylmuramoyl-L-alanine amidase
MFQVLNGSIFRKMLIAATLIGAGLLAASFVPKKVVKSQLNTVVIDAGHGGKDPGNLGTGRYKKTEKDISLTVALMLGAYIKKAFPEVKVIYTRDGDTFPALHERTQIANKANADLFISVHCNANTSREPYGSETYVMGIHKTEANLKIAQKENASILLEEDYEQNYAGLDPTTPEGIIALSLRQNKFLDHSLYFSSLVQKQFKERVGRKDRGVKQAGFYVISFTTMPSALIELGFLTNKEEEDFLISAVGQDYMASAIYRAFKEYKQSLDAGSEQVNQTNNPPEPTEPPVVQHTEIPNENQPSAENSKKRIKGVTFSVQLATTSAPVNIPEKFGNIEQVKQLEVNGKFKYFAGEEKTYEKATSLMEDIRKKGHSGAFVVAFEDGEPADLKKVLERIK